jgi:hypothetical protein
MALPRIDIKSVTAYLASTGKRQIKPNRGMDRRYSKMEGIS